MIAAAALSGTRHTSSGEQILDDGQRFALNAFREGKSLALVGGGGCGKSFLLKRILQQAEEDIGKFPYVVPCAHTNKAAEALNGITIHKLFGAKPSWEFSKEYLLEGIKKKWNLCELLRKIRLLIIDELSLLTSNVIDSMDYVLRYFALSEWHSSLPLGGRQLVVAGDPFQLEPYEQSGCVQEESLRTSFQSRTWYLVFGAPGDGVVINLRRNHRQVGDNVLFEILSRIRNGTHTEGDVKFLNNTSGVSMVPPPGHTRLCLTNEQVNFINQEHLNKLPGEVFKIAARDTYLYKKDKYMERRLDGVALKVVSLKRGARVMVTRKIGSIMPGGQAVVRKVKRVPLKGNQVGYEVEIETGEASSRHQDTGSTPHKTLCRITPVTYEVHRFDRTVVARREQLPLIPAYAITVHRSQGMTLGRMAINFNVATNWKPHGIAYVALSRCETSEGLWVAGLENCHISISERAKSVMKELWDLHVHMPPRIWGVDTVFSLSLSELDFPNDVPIGGLAECDDGSSRTPFEARYNEQCTESKAPCNDARSSTQRKKRKTGEIEVSFDENLDFDIIFVGFVKKRVTRI